MKLYPDVLKINHSNPDQDRWTFLYETQGTWTSELQVSNQSYQCILWYIGRRDSRQHFLPANTQSHPATAFLSPTSNLPTFVLNFSLTWASTPMACPSHSQYAEGIPKILSKLWVTCMFFFQGLEEEGGEWKSVQGSIWATHPGSGNMVKALLSLSKALKSFHVSGGCCCMCVPAALRLHIC